MISIIKQLYYKLRNQHESAFGLIRDTRHLIRYAQDLPIYNLYSLMIWSSIVFIIGLIIYQEWFLMSVVFFAGNALCLLGIGFLKNLHRFGWVVIVVLSPIAMLIIMIKKVCKHLKNDS